MRQSGTNLKYAALLFLLALLFGVSEATVAQQSKAQRAPENKILDTKVSEFELQNQTLADGLWKLAGAPAPFAFGLEKVLKKRLADPEMQDPSFSLQLRNKTVREILDALCQADSRFTWSVDGATINVFPRAVVNDPTYLLNRKLAKFELRNASDAQDGLLAIVHQLPPPIEQVANAQVGGADPYPPEPWTVSLENVTVRQVINRLAAHGGPSGIWIFGGANDFRSFGFFNTHPSPWLLKSKESRPEGARP
jgi:hypothetical protein